MYHPVLPYWTGGKLLFPLCRTFAEERPTDPQYRCCHSDPQRRFTGTWVSCKLNKALDGGYKLDQVYEVWHFLQQNTDLFRRYIDTFLKIKQESSGFPPQRETQEEKEKYIQEIRVFQHRKESCAKDHCQIIFELFMGKISSATTTA